MRLALQGESRKRVKGKAEASNLTNSSPFAFFILTPDLSGPSSTVSVHSKNKNVANLIGYVGSESSITHNMVPRVPVKC